MKNPKSEIRNPNVGWSRSVLDCGDLSPLSRGARPPRIPKRRPVGALQTLARISTLLLILFAASSSLRAQSFSIDWFTIDGGGGTSTGGVYSVSGTIGQPDAGGPLTNGQYSATGGFWALPTAVQVTGAPTLTIAPATSGNATISWTPNTPGFVLQESASLSPVNWTNSPSGAANPTVVPATLPMKFYRLFKP